MGYAGASADMLPTLWSDPMSSNEPILQGERASRKIVEFLTSIITYDEARQAKAEATLAETRARQPVFRATAHAR